jgi:hypothetical protein
LEQQDRNLSLEQLSAKYKWAVEIIQRHFEKGLGGISDSKFLDRRYAEFQRKDDPIYAELLKGMKDPQLAKTFVSYWMIAQTLATQSRFWLEAAVADIIAYQAKYCGRSATEVYSHAMLGHVLPGKRRTIVEIGAPALEHLAESSAWRVDIQRGVLNAIDILVGEQDRAGRPVRKPFQRHPWSQAHNDLARERDQAHLAHVADSLRGPPFERTTLQCNLLVIEPDKPDGQIHAWAIRFVNPKTFAQHPVRKQERVNLLRVYALLVQQKIVEQPKSISACVAALVPRESGRDQDQYPDYFSSDTYWSSDQLWDFIGVPFDVVRIAIHAAARGFRDKLKDGLRHLLPGAAEPEQAVMY